MSENYLINKKDLTGIISNAKNKIVTFNLPLHISGVEIDKTELSSLAILESVIMYFNQKKLLDKKVSIDYTDPCADHDPEPEGE